MSLPQQLANRFAWNNPNSNEKYNDLCHSQPFCRECLLLMLLLLQSQWIIIEQPTNVCQMLLAIGIMIVFVYVITIGIAIAIVAQFSAQLNTQTLRNH